MDFLFTYRILAANAIYKEVYGNEDGETIPATFQIYYWIGWKPDPKQPRALKPQKAQVSLQDIHKLDEVINKYEGDKK